MESGRETSRSRDSTRRAPRTSSPAFPDDRRAHAPRPSDHGCFPVEPIRSPPSPTSLSTSREKEINLPAIGETDARPGRRCERKLTDATQAVDGDSLRRSSSTSLESCARSSRVRYALNRPRGRTFKPNRGALPLTASICLVTFPVRRWSINPKSDGRSAQSGGTSGCCAN